ncbi:hypothetical protein GVAV_003123 [Gurleya vavrai]
MSKKNDKKEVASFNLKDFSIDKVKKAYKKHDQIIEENKIEKCESLIDNNQKVDGWGNNINEITNDSNKNNIEVILDNKKTLNTKQDNIYAKKSNNQNKVNTGIYTNRTIKNMINDLKNVKIDTKKEIIVDDFKFDKNTANDPNAFKSSTVEIKKKKIIKKKNNNGYSSVKIYDKETNEEEIAECPVCFNVNAQTVQLECNHVICFKCASRLFFIVKDKSCPICKTPSNIKLPDQLIKLKCQLCIFIASTHSELINHYRKHAKILCGECIHNKAEFPSEYTLYTAENISQHLKLGTDDENKRSFYGHIYCTFCQRYFYSADVCVKHCRTQHCICTICESMNQRHNYLKNMDELKIHAKEMHYMCEIKGCEGVGYGNNVELVNHLLRAHKIGDGRVLLGNKKNKTVFIMNPFEAEKKNRCKVLGEYNTENKFKGKEWETVDRNEENNFNMKSNGIREFEYVPMPLQLKNFKVSNPKIVLLRRGTESAFEMMPEYLQRKNEMHEQPKIGLKNNMNPSYLNRENIKEDKDYIAFNNLKMKYPDCFEEIYNSFESFKKRKISVDDFFERIEYLLGDKETVRFAVYIVRFCDIDSVKVIEEFGKKYKERITFPKFVKEEVFVYQEEKKDKKIGFKIVDDKKK